MANANTLVYARPSDNVAPDALITIQTGTIADGYEPEWIADEQPARPSILNETSGAWLFAYGAAQRVDWASLPHHNLTAGLEVRIQGNATDSWGAPTLNTTITIPTYRLDGFSPGPWVDLTGVGGYSTSGFQYWRFVVVGVNAAPIAIGELGLLNPLRTFDPNLSWGVTESEDRKLIEHLTNHGVSTIYDLGVTLRTLAGEIDAYPGTAKTDLRDLWRAARGRVLPFFIVPDRTVNESWMARFLDPKLDAELTNVDRSTLRFGLGEISRGLVL